MSFVLISPEVVSAAAGDLANVGSTISAANKAAAAATTQVLAAGADEVSARIAALFGMYGLEYQAISAQVAAYHQQFVQTLRTGAASYMLAEATNVEQNLLNLINAPTQTLLGRPADRRRGQRDDAGRGRRRRRAAVWQRRQRRARCTRPGWRCRWVCRATGQRRERRSRRDGAPGGNGGNGRLVGISVLG